MNTLKRLEQKLDALALVQLRDIAAKLYEELEETKQRLICAEDSAEFWREQVFNIQDDLSDSDITLGMTNTGELLLIGKQHRAV